VDHSSVYVAGVSDAGVLSDVVPVHLINWTATFGGKVPGVTTTNPHVLKTTGDYLYTAFEGPAFGGALVPDGLWAREASSYAGVITPGDSQQLTEDVVGGVWENVTPGPAARYGAVSAYDSSATRVVLFGGCPAGEGCNSPLTDTWFWDGLNWTNETSGLNASPTGRVNGVMAYDANHQQLVLFGGETWFNGTWTALNDTWTFQTGGSGWVNATPSGLSPNASAGASMVYDSVRKVIVLQTTDGLTWTWNGSAWSGVTPPSGNPPARVLAGMSFDSIRGVAVLFGGCEGSTSFCTSDGTLASDTWEWDGLKWTQVDLNDVEGPPARAGFGMTYDAARGVSILFGGYEFQGQPVLDPWEWDGKTWNEIPSEANLPARFMTGFVYDSARSVSIALGGCTAFEEDGNPCASVAGDVWSWDGRTFGLLNLDGIEPGVPGGYPGVVFDTSRYVDVFFDQQMTTTTELNSVYELSGDAWSPVNPDSLKPNPRLNAAMVFDSAASQTVLFGGDFSDGTVNQSDTWTWNGTSWNNVTPGSGPNPSARRNHSMAFDPDRGVTVLFGGYTNTVVGDTWELNESPQVNAPDGGVVTGAPAWEQITLDGGTPAPRDQAMMTFDQSQGQTVLFGGSGDGTSGNLNDTWEYTSSGWTQFAPASSPPPREDGAFVYDPNRGVDVLFGGISNNSASTGYNDLWEWDGSTWTSVANAGVPPRVGSWAGYTFDINLNGVLLAGGLLGNTLYNETWLLPTETNRVPLEVAQFSFAAAGAVSPVITQMTFNAYVGGAGNTVQMPGRGTPTPGATVGVWTSGGSGAGSWSIAGQNNAPPSTPTQVLHTTQSATEAQSYLYGPTQTINLAFVPMWTRGNGLGATEVSVDYVEVTVSYQQ
jgi:hypothetical protein